MIWLFLLGFVCFISGCCLSYMPALKESVWYWPLWILVAGMGTLGWGLVSKSVPDASKLLIVGLYWDTLMQLTYLLMPLLIFGARLTMTQSAGAVLIFLGLVLTRG